MVLNAPTYKSHMAYQKTDNTYSQHLFMLPENIQTIRPLVICMRSEKIMLQQHFVMETS